VLRDERLVAAVVDDELEREPLRIGEDERAVAARAPPTRSAQKSSASSEPTRNQTTRCTDGEFMVLVGPSGCGKTTRCA
jgi:flagellar biosynthesis GTPase FlhF